MTKETLKEKIIFLLRASAKKLFNGRNRPRIGLAKSEDFKLLVQTIAQMEREQSVVFTKKEK